MYALTSIPNVSSITRKQLNISSKCVECRHSMYFSWHFDDRLYNFRIPMQCAYCRLNRRYNHDIWSNYAHNIWIEGWMEYNDDAPGTMTYGSNFLPPLAMPFFSLPRWEAMNFVLHISLVEYHVCSSWGESYTPST